MNGIIRSIVVTGSFALIVGGCAKKELVKSGELAQPASQAAGATQPSSAKAEPVVRSGGVTETPVKAVSTPVAAPTQEAIGLQTIYFDFDSYLLKGEAWNILQKNSGWLNQHEAARIRIEGNCDERGSDEYNLALGEKRAKAAMQYLISMGIPAERLSVVSYGKERPADPAHNEAAWAKNRRDQFVLISP